MAKQTKVLESERQEALLRLRTMLSPGDTLYTIVRHVSASGMRRTISVARVNPTDLDIEVLDFWVARVVRARIDQRRGGVVQDGAGMDMGFHLVYNLGRHLWPDGTPRPHGTRNGEPDSNGGYALKQRWL